MVVGPVEERKRERALPREHHRVALDQLEERRKDGLGECRGARSPLDVEYATGRTVVAGRARKTSSAGRYPCRPSSRDTPSTKIVYVSSVKATNGNVGSSSCVGWKSAKRDGRTAASPSAPAVESRSCSRGTWSAE